MYYSKHHRQIHKFGKKFFLRITDTKVYVATFKLKQMTKCQVSSQLVVTKTEVTNLIWAEDNLCIYDNFITTFIQARFYQSLVLLRNGQQKIMCKNKYESHIRNEKAPTSQIARQDKPKGSSVDILLTNKVIACNLWKLLFIALNRNGTRTSCTSSHAQKIKEFGAHTCCEYGDLLPPSCRFTHVKPFLNLIYMTLSALGNEEG